MFARLPHQFRQAARVSGRRSFAPVLAAPLLCPWLAACGGGGADNGAGRAAPATPVTVAAAAMRQVPLTLEAPGTLQAINSVAIRPRVDGEIVAVGFREGAEVTAGQVLFRIDPRPLEAALAEARAVLGKDAATLDRNRAQLARYTGLADKGYVSSDDYAQVTANLRIAEATVAADRAAVDAAKLNLDYCVIRAPISGRTSVIAYRAGSLVKAADAVTLTTVTQMDPLFVDFSVPQRYLDTLSRRFDAVTLRITSGDGDAERGARLEFIDNAVDTTTGSIHLRGRADNADRALWPGEFVDVKLEVGGGPAVLTVPTAAVGNGPDGSYVFVVDASGHAHQRPVTVDRQEGDVAVVAGGVKAGEQVVVDGQSRLRDGATVQVTGAAGHT